MKKVLFTAVLFLQVFFLSCIDSKLATVGGISVNESDVSDRMKGLDKNLVKSMGEDKLKAMVLKGLIEENLVYLDLREKGYDKEDKPRQEWMKNLRGFSTNYFLNTFLPEEYPVSKDNLKTEYQKNRAQFKQEGRIKISHILARIGSGFLDEKFALKKIKQVTSELKDDGSNFEELAARYSDCPSGKDGGDLGFMGRGEMLPEFEAVVFKMKASDIRREPVKTKFGYHLIKISEIENDKYSDIDEVKDFLSNIVNIRNLRDEYKPELFPEKLKNASSDIIIGKTIKSDINYKYSDLLEDIKIFMGPIDIDKMKKDREFSRRVIDEMILSRIMENKMNELKMSENSNYNSFIKKREKEFFVNSFIKVQLGSQIKVNNQDIRKEVLSNSAAYRLRYGNKFVKDIKIKNEVDKVIAKDIEQNKISELLESRYKLYVDDLKKRYTVVMN